MPGDGKVRRPAQLMCVSGLREPARRSSPRGLSVAGLEARVADCPAGAARSPRSAQRRSLQHGVRRRRRTGRYVDAAAATFPSTRLSEPRMRAASIAAISPACRRNSVYAEPGVMVVRFVEGRTLRKLIVREPRADRRAADDVPLDARALTSRVRRCAVLGLPCDSRFTRARLARGTGAGRCALRGRRDALEAAQAPLPMVFGHHDSSPGTSSTRASACGSSTGNTPASARRCSISPILATNGAFAADDDVRLLEAYFESTRAFGIRRSFGAMKVASALREAAWAMGVGDSSRPSGCRLLGHAARTCAAPTPRFAQYAERRRSTTIFDGIFSWSNPKPWPP
jgi:hypothetical protein